MQAAAHLLVKDMIEDSSYFEGRKGDQEAGVGDELAESPDLKTVHEIFQTAVEYHEKRWDEAGWKSNATTSRTSRTGKWSISV
jgi:hypothetical protein